jgi:hypothetical protein
MGGGSVPKNLPPVVGDAVQQQFAEALGPEAFAGVKELVTEIAKTADMLRFDVGQATAGKEGTEVADQQIRKVNAERANLKGEKKVADRADRDEFRQKEKREGQRQNLRELFQKKDGQEIQVAFWKTLAGNQRQTNESNKQPGHSTLQPSGKQEAEKQQAQFERGPQRQTADPKPKTSQETAKRQTQLTPQLKADIKKYGELQKQLAQLRDQLQQQTSEKKTGQENLIRSQFAKLEGDISKLKIGLELAGIHFSKDGRVQDNKKETEDKQKLAKLKDGEKVDGVGTEDESSASKGNKQTDRVFKPVRPIKDGMALAYKQISSNNEGAQESEVKGALRGMEQGLIVYHTHSETATGNAVHLYQQGQDSRGGGSGRFKGEEKGVPLGKEADPTGALAKAGVRVDTTIAGTPVFRNEKGQVFNAYQLVKMGGDAAKGANIYKLTRNYIFAYRPSKLPGDYNRSQMA